MKKKLIVLIIIYLSFCSILLNADNQLYFFTIDELKQYDGNNNSKAFIAVNNIVYDVTNHPEWKNSFHKNAKAGEDVTSFLKSKTPNETGELKNLPSIGKLVKGYTLNELKNYNGKKGQKAYVAIDGIVYDVTNHPEWKNGTHHGGAKAGRDLTNLLKTRSPHGIKVLKKLPIVGKIID